MLVGVITHAHGPVWEIAEHTAAVFTGDHGLPTAADGVPLLRAVITAPKDNYS